MLKEKPEIAVEFKQEMERFLPSEQISRIMEQKSLCDFIAYLLEDLGSQI